MAIRVYVIDEHSEVRRNLVRRLSAAEGVQVVGHSGDACTALRDIRGLRPDVVLLEVKMRRAEGVEVCSQVTQLDSGVKVVVITSYADAKERRKVQQAGAAAYLLKDLDTPGLVQRLSRLMEPQIGQVGGAAMNSTETTRRQSESKKGGEKPLVTYSRILVPLDGSELSEQVLPFVRALGSALRSPIELMRIYTPATPEMADAGHGRYLDQVDAGFRDEALDYLKGVKESLRALEVEVSCTAEGGDPASCIIGAARNQPGTLIAMSTHGRSGITRWVLGSVADKVLRQSGVPVLLIRPPSPEE